MPWIFGWALIASLGLLSGCVDGNGARYWRLIYWLMGVVEEKSPCGSRSFGWLGSTTSSTSRLPHFTIWGAKVQKAGAKVPPTKALVWALTLLPALVHIKSLFCTQVCNYCPIQYYTKVYRQSCIRCHVCSHACPCSTSLCRALAHPCFWVMRLGR